jgi:hypothetical protein
MHDIICDILSRDLPDVGLAGGLGLESTTINHVTVVTRTVATRRRSAVATKTLATRTVVTRTVAATRTVASNRAVDSEALRWCWQWPGPVSAATRSPRRLGPAGPLPTPQARGHGDGDGGGPLGPTGPLASGPKLQVRPLGPDLRVCALAGWHRDCWNLKQIGLRIRSGPSCWL